MKKMNNKGFSLVELIIVIAIMAILAGAIAPALIRYIDKSRKSNDVTSGKAIKTAIESAMTDEDIFAYLTSADDGKVVTITITPGQATSDGEDAEAKDSGAIKIEGATKSDDMPTDIDKQAKSEIGTNIGEKTPKIKYKKDKAEKFVAYINNKGTIYVYATTKSGSIEATKLGEDGTGAWQLVPEVSKKYSK
ncbi:MAG: type II secretion system protein [Lachnospiraceae bacterium]|nr:type II secretion system protein [Lachnospiraceae bacterium]